MIMTEAIVIAISTPLVGLFCGWCSGMSDSTMYDEKAESMWMHTYRGELYHLDRHKLLIDMPVFTRYHIGHPNDAWHWIRRAERYGGYVTAVVSGAFIGVSWWLLPMVVCHSIAGLVGFNLGDRWKGSMWMRKLGEWINGE